MRGLAAERGLIGLSMNSLAGRGTDALTECQGVQSSSQPLTLPTHSTLMQSRLPFTEMFLKLSCIHCLRVLNVLTSHLFSLHTELSSRLRAFLIAPNTDDTRSVLPVLAFRKRLRLSSPYGYLSLDEGSPPPAEPFKAGGACQPRIVWAVEC